MTLKLLKLSVLVSFILFLVVLFSIAYLSYVESIGKGTSLNTKYENFSPQTETSNITKNKKNMSIHSPINSDTLDSVNPKKLPEHKMSGIS